MSALSKDLRHCLGTHSCGDNDDNDRAPAPALLAAAKLRGRTTAPVVLMGAEQPALEQGREELA
ncbi:MAG: hypothetical protein H7270_15025 [Dermatophilaceae bacterium]|nr:hypothetical protein [Dermatophilaceae bacterium]